MDHPDTDQAQLHLVTLGAIDVDPTVLTGDGTTLREAIGPHGVDDRSTDVAPHLPATGWRLVHQIPARPEWGGNTSFAAPRGNTPEAGWAVATVSSPLGGGVPILSANPGPVHVHPGRATRRAGLSLTWAQNLTAPAGSIPRLHVQLSNTTHQVWTNVVGATAHVRGWLLDSAGHRLETASWFAYGAGDPLPTLQPGETAQLPVDLAAYDYANVTPGTYPLDAVAVSLDLHAEPGTLLLH
jgi:hypothetical protein